MKKYLTLLILIFALSPVALADDWENSEVVHPEDVIFRSSLTDVVQDLSDTSEEYSDDKDFQQIDPYNMPFFKQMRLRLSNKYLEMSEKAEQKREQNITPKWKFWQKNKEQTLQTTEPNAGAIEESIASEVNVDLEDSLSLEGAINAEVTEKQLILDADNINFDEDTGDMVATGRPKLYLPPQNTTIVADKMTYNEDSNILKGHGNVVILKDGKPINSDYVEINMNEETIMADKMVLKTENMNLDAESAIQKDGMIILNKGTLYSDKSQINRIATRMIGPRFETMIVPEEAQSMFFGDPKTGNNMNIHIDSIDIDARDNHDVIKLKNVKFYHGDKYLFRLPGITAYTNKERDFFEASYPEFGSKRKLGMFIGPGFAFGGPFGSVLKVIPFLNYKDDFGIGGMLKYTNTYNRTELGYGSSNDIFFLRGKQRFDDNLFLHYAANSYTDEWFLGGRMAKYMAEVYYTKSYLNRNFLAKGLDLTFRHRAGFGLMQDDDRSYYGEKFPDANNMSTTRTRYMAEINQTLFKYKNKEKRQLVEAGVVMQGSAALYGTGDTQFIARIGPRVKVQYKNWMQEAGYFLTGFDDKTPMPRYDAYRYGSQSVYLREAFRLTKYVTIGWSGYVTLSDDSPNGKLFQENAFLVSLGPDDCKVIFGYDFVRQRTYFGINLAFDPKGTNVNYEKMVIKNPEKLGRHSDENEHQIAFAPAKQDSEISTRKSLFNKQDAQKTKVLEYAQVIDIEDPDKETIE